MLSREKNSPYSPTILMIYEYTKAFSKQQNHYFPKQKTAVRKIPTAA
jgi:uncharacterized membrane protein